MSIQLDSSSSIPLEIRILNDISALSGRSSAVNVATSPPFEPVAANSFGQSVPFDEALTSNEYLYAGQRRGCW